MGVLAGLEPVGFMHYFEEISKIPRGSYNEKEISNYCANFAKERNLEYYQDELNNVVIIKEASEGYENEEPIILQGHMDMVCEKVVGSDHDFMIDPLDLYIEDDFIKARGTTLGGDDGVAVAIALALLDDDTLKHPRLEVIFTIAEEVGMDGAAGIDLSMLKGHQMLNLDSEEEGIFLTGCAGGTSTTIELPVEYKTVEDTVKEYTFNVSGLVGGHSGAEINKGRASAGLLIGNVLMTLETRGIDFDIVSIEAGTKENVICPYGTLKFLTKDIEAAKDAIRYVKAVISEEYGKVDPDITFEIAEEEVKGIKAVSDKCKRDIVFMLNLTPYGIQKMSAHIAGLVETSLNPGVIDLSEGVFKMTYAVRSSVNGAKDMLNDKLKLFADYVGAKISIRGEYPAWEYRADSPLRDKMVRIFEDMYDKEPVVEAIHAGLECGLLAEKIADLDCVSIGPNIYDIHTPKERLDIKSARRCWEYIVRVLEEK